MHYSVSMMALMSLLLLLGSCQQTGDLAPTAPVATPTTLQQGVSARINNQVWQSVTEQTATAKDYYAIRGGINPNELTIIGFGAFSSVSNAAKTDRITLFLANVSGNGTYPLSGGSQAVYTAISTAGLINYMTDATRTGTATVTKYDLKNGLVSGTFAFTAAAGSATVTVTDGQFTDVPFGK